MARTTPESGGRLVPYSMRVERVDEGCTLVVRTLSVGIGGCMTHYDKDGSAYCNPVGCRHPLHGRKTNWKGYIAAEAYFQAKNLWCPIVLELTENLEVDMRDVYKRGQVWEIFRAMRVGKKFQPVAGKLLEERDATTFPSPFDIYPVLARMYHVQRVDLSAPNPMPRRVLVTPTSAADAPPPVIPTIKDAGATDEERAAFSEWIRNRVNPNRGKNGQAKAVPHD